MSLLLGAHHLLKLNVTLVDWMALSVLTETLCLGDGDRIEKVSVMISLIQKLVDIVSFFHAEGFSWVGNGKTKLTMHGVLFILWLYRISRVKLICKSF